jgi:aryl-alcohol dehydrogenase-like predicted oxidoreductase
MTFGTANAERYGECSKDSAFEILDYFFSQGGNFIDTANGYREEQSELWLGEWLSSRNNRDQIVLATKYKTGWQGHKKEQGVPIQANFGGNGMKSMRVSLDASLRKLQTEYIDLFMSTGGTGRCRSRNSCPG